MRKLRLLITCLLGLILSGCFAKADKPTIINGLDADPKTLEFIKTVIQTNETADLEAIMRSRGYYNAKVSQETTKEKEIITVKSGKRTQIVSIRVEPSKYKSLLSGIAKGDPLNADKVIAAQNALYKTIEKQGCAFNLDVTHGVILNENNTAELIYYVKEGQDAKFGSVIFTGAKTVDQKYIEERAKWEEGKCYKHETIRQTRKQILATGLFAGADVRTPEQPNRDGNVPVEFILEEAKHRTVRAGFSFYTDEGPGIVLGWEHRNFSGQGEKLKAELRANLLEQLLEAEYTKPYFYRDDQTLKFRTNITREDTDAFESLGTGAGFSLNRDFTKALKGSIGADIDFTRIEEENEEEEDFLILSPFASLAYDTRNNTLDPTKGALLSASIAPSFDMLGESDPYFITEITGRAYYQAHEKITFATRLKVGSIIGASTGSLPATERFFAGGGGSVRGFGFQEVGPVDEDDDPEGGRAIVEGSTELRFKATEKIGGVFFIDYAQISDESSPNIDNLSFGAGAGARYYTDFGPIRFDVGVPLNNDENVDESFQFYISIGQAF